MVFFDRHIDRELGPLGGGALPPRRFRRVVRHSRNCHRCAALYERSIRVLRQLENRSPLVPAQIELEAIVAYNLPRVMGAAPRSRRGWSLGLLGLSVASTLAVLVWRGQGVEDEFAVRGAGGPAVALRVFCGGGGAPLGELAAGGHCAVGQSLAFAVGAASTHAQVALAVSGDAAAAAGAQLEVKAVAGAEEPVALTIALEREGTLEVIAAFAPDAVSAAAAARGERVTGVVVLRRTVRVAP